MRLHGDTVINECTVLDALGLGAGVSISPRFNPFAFDAARDNIIRSIAFDNQPVCFFFNNI